MAGGGSLIMTRTLVNGISTTELLQLHTPIE